MKQFFITIIGFLFFTVIANAQDQYFQGNDSIQTGDSFILFEDSLAVDSAALVQELTASNINTFHPNPNKAILYSAVVPGLGQIYNRKYWKLPLVYGSFMGCIYAITWNNTQYGGYKNAYRDFQLITDADGKPLVGSDGRQTYETKGDSWIKYSQLRGFPEERAEFSSSEVTNFSDFLKNRRNYFRRYRDMSYFIGVGLYAIWIIDAYVDAQLFDFDVSNDLSMRMEPVILERTASTRQTVGLQWSLRF